MESPYGAGTAVDLSGGIVPEPLAPFAKFFDFGPRFKVTRLSPIEDPLIVRYWISIWDTLHLRVYIDLLDDLPAIGAETSGGVTGLVPENLRAMRISPYLRNMS